MPASMMIAETGSMVEVMGSRIAMGAAGPRPGSTPMIMPISKPISQESRWCGSTTSAKPSRNAVRSMITGRLDRDQVGQRDSQPVEEQEVERSDGPNAEDDRV